MIVRSAVVATALVVCSAASPGGGARAEGPGDPELGSLFDGSTRRSRGRTGAAEATATPEVGPVKEAAREAPASKAGAPEAAPPSATGSPAAPPAGEAAPEPPLDDIPGSDWRVVGSVRDPVNETDPSSREKQDFWDRLKNNTFWGDISDTACREVKIPASTALGLPGAARVKPAFERYLRRAPDGRYLLVDRLRLAIGASGGLAVANLAAGKVPIYVSGGAEIDGTSQVIRPLEGKRACRELDELLDLREFKAALPLKAERFPAMREGEIWTIPLRLRAWVGAGVSASVEGAPVSISFGYSREGGSSVTLRRLDAKTLRVRLRMDYVNVYGPGGGVTLSLLGSDLDRFRSEGKEWTGDSLGELAGQGAWKLLDREVRGTAERYLAARLNWWAHWSRGDHALFELLLDPGDAGHMAALERLLAGGDVPALDSLAKLASSAASMLPDLKPLERRLPGLLEAQNEALGSLADGVRGFTGAERVEGFGSSLWLKIPLALDYRRDAGTSDERITFLDGSGGRYHIFRSHKESSTGLVDLPLVGRVVQSNARRSVMTFAYEDGRGEEQPVALVYVHQEGYTLQNQPQARALAVEADSMMRLAGTRGRGENSRAGLPLERVFPARELAEEPPALVAGRLESGEAPRRREPTYRRGYGAFTLVLGERALAEVLDCSPEEVLRAYARMLRSEAWFGEAAERAVVAGRLRPDLSVEYDDSALPETFPGSGEPGAKRNLQDAVRISLQFGSRLARELRRIAAMPSGGGSDARRRQALAVRDLVAGSVGWGISYESVLKVLVQLVDPRHLSAEFVAQAQPLERGLGKVEGRYLLNRGIEEDPALRRLGETVSRFSGPSAYGD